MHSIPPHESGAQNTSKCSHALCVVGFVYFEIHVPELVALPAPGEELFVSRLPATVGGAFNTASVAQQLGVDVALAYPQGEGGLTDAAVSVALERAGIAAYTWAALPDPALTLVLAGARDRAMISACAQDALKDCPSLPHARWIHVPGLREASLLAAPLAQARQRGAMISVSGSWAPDHLSTLREQTDQRWDLLVLNAKEATAAVGNAEAAPDLLRHVAKNIVVTHGPQGAFGCIDEVFAQSPAIATEVVDTTGAGDAFCAGLLTALLHNKPASQALNFGNQVAAKLLTRRGGSVMGQSDLFAHLKGTL